MKVTQTLVVIAAFVAIVLHVPSVASAQNNQPTATVTIQHPMPPDVVELLKHAAVDAGGALVTGGVYKIPLNMAASVIQGQAHKQFARWLGHLQICQEFAKMWAGCRPPMSGRINVEIVVSQGPPEVRVIVPFFAQLSEYNGGKPVGYVTPIGPNGQPTMKLDVFGDGSLVLDRMDCPKRQ